MPNSFIPVLETPTSANEVILVKFYSDFKISQQSSKI